jgi:hypothetical protein
MSNDVVPYSDSHAIAPYGADGGSDGVVTHAVSSPVIYTSEDKQLVTEFGNVAESYGLDAAKSTKAAEKFYRDLMTRQVASDDDDRKQVRAQMQREWGGNYGANVKRIKALVDSLPVSVSDILWDGRTEEGTLALNDPSVLRWLLGLTRPAGAYQGQPGNSVDAEIQQILEVMRRDRTRYNRDTAMQQRLRDLYEMKG